MRGRLLTLKGVKPQGLVQWNFRAFDMTIIRKDCKHEGFIIAKILSVCFPNISLFLDNYLEAFAVAMRSIIAC